MSSRISVTRRLMCLLTVAVAALGVVAASARASGLQVQSVSSWKQDASPMGWSSSLNRVFYNVRGANGLYDAYSANPDGSDPQCLTCSAPSFSGVGTATNRGVSDVSPDGNWMLVSVEVPHPGQIGATWTQPGKGGDNDIYLESTNGSQMWPLTDITAPNQTGTVSLGTNWARFNRTGTQIVWASMYSPAVGNLGLWQLKTADIVWSGGVPSLADVQTIDPVHGSFYEPYGFSPDDSQIIFATSAGQASWQSDSIDAINTNGTGLTQLSPPDGTGLSAYNEFAFYVPDTNQIIYGSARDALSGGMDYWQMNDDGSGAQPLTSFNQPWSTESMGYSVVGGLAFDPNDPDHFIAGVAADPNAQSINAVSITLDSSGAGQGLDEAFYNGQGFSSAPVATSVSDPSAGFAAATAPAGGLGSTNYGIRWSGTVTAPASGTYSLCAVSDTSAQVYVSGNLLVNALGSFGQRKCTTTTLTAGQPTPIVMTDEHSLGPAYAQLTWITPGASTPSQIPVADLTPAPESLATTATGTTAATTAGATQTATKKKAKKSSAACRSAATRGHGVRAHARGRARHRTRSHHHRRAHRHRRRTHHESAACRS